VPAGRVERDWSQPYQHIAVVAVFKSIYEDPERDRAEYDMCEKLVDVEENFLLWRFRHVKTVERITGFKRGTGGTAGVVYLRKTLETRLFPADRCPHRASLRQIRLAIIAGRPLPDDPAQTAWHATGALPGWSGRHSCLPKEGHMAKYITLLNWTEQGIRGAKQTVERARAARQMLDGMGVKMTGIWWPLGPYDIVCVLEAPASR